MRTRHVLAATAALALAGSTAGAALTGASAAPAQKAKPTVTTVAKKLVGPLSVAQAPDGTRYWTDNFAGPLYKQTAGGAADVVYQGPKKAAAEAVSADGGVLRFTTGSGNNKSGKVWTLDTAGAPVLIGDTCAYEKSANPDGKFKYGFLGPEQVLPGPAAEADPGVLQGRQGDPPLRHGHRQRRHLRRRRRRQRGPRDLAPPASFSTVAALQPVKVKVTKARRRGRRLPSCAVGKKYAFEAVPTDIEVGPDGTALRHQPARAAPRTAPRPQRAGAARSTRPPAQVATIVRGLLSPDRRRGGQQRRHLRGPAVHGRDLEDQGRQVKGQALRRACRSRPRSR